MSAFGDLSKSLNSLSKDVQEYRSQQWEIWLDDTRAAVSSKQLRSIICFLEINTKNDLYKFLISVLLRRVLIVFSLRTGEPVVHFEQGKLMHVNYNPELVGLIREVRHLALLGYKIPMAILEAADLAKQFMRQAKSLQQVCQVIKLLT